LSFRAWLRGWLIRAGLLEVAFRLRDSWRALTAADEDGATASSGGIPVPPAHLRELVAGTSEPSWFLSSGERAAHSIREVMGRHGLAPDRLASILDFGCGCGRVIRHWAGRPVRLEGADRNRRLIAWCRRNLRFASFQVNRLRPPLRSRDGEFELVYALSVFTHLPEDLQRPWMEELRRVTAPGGHIVISLHGEAYRDELTAGERARFDQGSLVVRGREAAGRNACGAYHPRSYVRGVMAEGLTLLDHVPEGAAGNPRQDLILFRRD
jgi:SAM-dependent methyltransferase